MFTGIIQSLGELVELLDEPPGKRLVVRAPGLAGEAAIGESFAINGCCLTVVARAGDTLSFQAGPETLAKTTLGRLVPGSRVNVEPALRASDRLGGHFVAGHVDGLARLAAREDQNEWSTFWFAVDSHLARQMAPKGSVTVDGVSLTLVEVESARFSVALIPHTLSATTLGRLTVGEEVNIETDILAKYVERLLATSIES